MEPSDVDQQLIGLAGLGDPIRRALYRYVADRGVPVSRDEAAKAAGISRPLAAYHLDKLVDDDPTGTSSAALNRAATTLGAELGTEAASGVAPDGDPDQVLAAVRQALAARGYEPYNGPDGTIRLRN